MTLDDTRFKNVTTVITVVPISSEVPLKIFSRISTYNPTQKLTFTGV